MHERTIAIGLGCARTRRKYRLHRLVFDRARPAPASQAAKGGCLKMRMIAIAGVGMISLAACGSATSTSAPATATTSQPAVASHPPTTASAVPVATATVLSPTTAPATVPTTAPATPGSVKTVTLWCGSGNIYAEPSLSAWEAGPGDNTIDTIKRTTAYIESAQQVQANPYAVYAAQLCGEVLYAEGYPPPVDQSTWAAAMSDFLQASQILHSTPGAPAVSTARPYLNSGTTELDKFLAAVGISESI
jgi:hypothetical protein